MLVNFRKYIYYSLVKNTLHKFKSLIFRTPPGSGEKDVLSCSVYPYDDNDPMVPVGYNSM